MGAIKAKLVVALAAAGASLAAVTPAFATFTSLNKESKGNAESVEMTLEAGGATIACQAPEESLSKGKWTIKNGGEPATTGPDLILDIEKWGKCTGKSSEIKETTAEVSECQLEVVQPSNETSVKGKLVTTCTIKVSSCELKLEAKANENLSSTLLYASGSEDETTFADPEVTNIATTVKGTCPGIKESKEGKLIGALEAMRVQREALGQFAVSSSRPFVFGTGSTSEATITIRRRTGFTAQPTGKRPFQSSNEPFTQQEPAFKYCTTIMVYSVGASCSYIITYNSMLGVGWYALFIWGEDAVDSVVWVRGR